MKKPVLVVLAAGMGSRYHGLKQIDPMGKYGEKILDYSVYDARRAGFETVVFVIKPEMEAAFEESVGGRLRDFVEVRYAFQTLESLPQGFAVPEGRTKPWGTGHAVLCAASCIDAPFAVINADDYYGPSGYKLLFDLLSREQDGCAMVAYPLRSTVTESGHVSRGICEVGEDGLLKSVTERTWIETGAQGIAYSEDEGKTFTALPEDVPVSMNFWGFPQRFLEQAKKDFPEFLNRALSENPLKAEYFLPSIVSRMIDEQGTGVFNGDVGEIIRIFPQQECMVIRFDDRIATYTFDMLNELELAYAITIHKSQGSEYPAVVIPIYSGPRMLMTRNLIYTAVTRAKKCVCLVGLPEMFQFMVENEMEQKRYSGLKDRILEIEPGLDK